MQKTRGNQSKEKKVPIPSLISKWKKERVFMRQSRVWHVSPMNEHFHVGQMVTLGPSTRAGTLAHEVQRSYLLPWKVTTNPDENGGDCWCWHDEFDVNDSLCVFGTLSRAWNDSFRCRPSPPLRSMGACPPWENFTEAEDSVKVYVARVGALGTGVAAWSATKACLISITSSSRLCWAVDGVSEERLSKCALLSLAGLEGKVDFFFGKEILVVTVLSLDYGIAEAGIEKNKKTNTKIRKWSAIQKEDMVRHGFNTSREGKTVV